MTSLWSRRVRCENRGESVWIYVYFSRFDRNGCDELFLLFCARKKSEEGRTDHRVLRGWYDRRISSPRHYNVFGPLRCHSRRRNVYYASTRTVSGSRRRGAFGVTGRPMVSVRGALHRGEWIRAHSTAAYNSDAPAAAGAGRSPLPPSPQRRYTASVRFTVTTRRRASSSNNRDLVRTAARDGSPSPSPSLTECACVRPCPRPRARVRARARASSAVVTVVMATIDLGSIVVGDSNIWWFENRFRRTLRCDRIGVSAVNPTKLNTKHISRRVVLETIPRPRRSIYGT